MDASIGIAVGIDARRLSSDCFARASRASPTPTVMVHGGTTADTARASFDSCAVDCGDVKQPLNTKTINGNAMALTFDALRHHPLLTRCEPCIRFASMEMR
ncbi:MAG: hypothetical protein DWH96_06595 [Planctomycetota bacterium]|nr:MAG: hypothetical protein DWH96_06595 [Planctomycetota bacterium]